MKYTSPYSLFTNERPQRPMYQISISGNRRSRIWPVRISMLYSRVRDTVRCICSSAAGKLIGTALSLVGSIVPSTGLGVGRLLCIDVLQDCGQPYGLTICILMFLLEYPKGTHAGHELVFPVQLDASFLWEFARVHSNMVPRWPQGSVGGNPVCENSFLRVPISKAHRRKGTAPEEAREPSTRLSRCCS